MDGSAAFQKASQKQHQAVQVAWGTTPPFPDHFQHFHGKDAYLEDGTPEELLRALNTIARSRGMSALARDTGISREALYKAFSDNGNPTLDTLLRVMKALGVRLAVAA